jgi:Mor family transcriptional regulator
MLQIPPEELPDPYPDLAKTIGLEATLKLARVLGGECVYFRKLDVQMRNRRILEEYDGYNMRKLSAQYGITAQRIKQIIRQR